MEWVTRWGGLIVFAVFVLVLVVLMVKARRSSKGRRSDEDGSGSGCSAPNGASGNWDAGDVGGGSDTGNSC